MTAPSSTKRRIQTLTTCTLLATTVHAQLQLTGDPLRDGVLMRPLRTNKDGQQQYVLYDFRPAFPPYTQESLRELLLLPKEDRGDDDGEGLEDIQANETDDTSIDDGHDTVSDSVEEVTEAIVDPGGGSDVADLDAMKEAAFDEDVHMEVSASDSDEQTSQEGHDQDFTASDEMVQHKETSMVDSEAEQEADSTISSVAERKPVYASEEAGEHSNQDEAEITTESPEEMHLGEPIISSEDQSNEDLIFSSATDATTNIDPDEKVTSDVTEVSTEDSSTSTLPEDVVGTRDTSAVSELDFVDEHKLNTEESTDISDALNEDFANSPVNYETLQPKQPVDADETETSQRYGSQSMPDTEVNEEYATEYSYSTLGTGDISTHQETADEITISYDSSPPQSNLQHKDEDANRQFVTGLDEIDKLFESVSPPDELDVGADGSSIQDVLVGQGLKIILKRAKSFGSSVKERFEKIVEKALPQQLVDLAGEKDEEDEDSLEDILTMMKKGDLSLGKKGGAGDKIQTNKETNHESENDEGFSNNERLNKLKERFPLLKTQRANKLFQYARRKWIEAKHLFDEIFSIFGGDDDDDDFEFNTEDMNFDNVRSLVKKNRLKVNEGAEMPQFGSMVDDSIVRSRYDAMMQLNERNSK